jgi:hypothetical protein
MSRSYIDENGNRVIILETEPDGICEMCGSTDELRPYGPRGENVCFDCGMKDPEAAARRLRQHLFGEGLDS